MIKGIREKSNQHLEDRKMWQEVAESLQKQLQEVHQEIERYKKALDDIRNVSTLDEYEGANPNSLLSACYQIAKEASVKTQ